MSLARADLADDQKPGAVAWVVFLDKLGSSKMAKAQRRMGSGKIWCVAGEFAMLIPSRDVSRYQLRLSSGAQLAVAARHPAVFLVTGRIRVVRNRFPACAGAYRANFCRSLNHPNRFLQIQRNVSLFDFAPEGQLHASLKTSLPVYIL